jgi:hypothetical protein
MYGGVASPYSSMGNKPINTPLLKLKKNNNCRVFQLKTKSAFTIVTE